MLSSRAAGDARHLAGDEVDALLLAPLVVGDRLVQQPQRLLAGLAALELACSCGT